MYFLPYQHEDYQVIPVIVQCSQQHLCSLVTHSWLSTDKLHCSYSYCMHVHVIFIPNCLIAFLEYTESIGVAAVVVMTAFSSPCLNCVMTEHCKMMVHWPYCHLIPSHQIQFAHLMTLHVATTIPLSMHYLISYTPTDIHTPYNTSINVSTIYEVIIMLVYFHEFFKNWMFAFKIPRIHAFLPEISI